MRFEPARSRKLTKLTVPAILLCMSLAGCRESEPAAENSEAPVTSEVPVFAGEGRDRLCLKEGEERAGFITYAAGTNANCSVRGTVGGQGAIKPDGDTACTIPFTRDGNRITLRDGGPACAYYCGPNASFAGKTFVRMDKAEAVVDLAGEPLC
jgi:hypothetical protein